MASAKRRLAAADGREGGKKKGFVLVPAGGGRSEVERPTVCWLNVDFGGEAAATTTRVTGFQC